MSEYFLTPLLSVIALVIGSLVLLGPHAVYIGGMSVPEPLNALGYTAPVVEQRLAANILDIERMAVTRPEARRLAVSAQEGTLIAIANYLQLTPIVRALQNSGGFLDYSIHGNIVEEPNLYSLYLQVEGRDRRTVDVTIARAKDQIDELLVDGANAIAFIIEPSLVCAALLRRELDKDASDFASVSRCIEQGLASDHSVWLNNLAGVVHFLKGDQAGAMNEFRAAVQRERQFDPALTNIGILYSLNGRHEEANKAFAQVLHGPRNEETPQTYAAAYIEWARNLIALGKHDEAVTKLEQAVKADPEYAEAYFSLADAVGPGKEAEELRLHGAEVATKNGQVFPENLVGVIRQRGWTVITD